MVNRTAGYELYDLICKKHNYAKSGLKYTICYQQNLSGVLDESEYHAMDCQIISPIFNNSMRRQ